MRGIRLFCLVLCSLPAHGVEINGHTYVGLAARTLLQHGIYHNAFHDSGRAIPDSSRGAVMTDLTLGLHPTPDDAVWVWLRWARGHALNDTGGLVLPPYGGDLEDDVKGINGRGRDYLLEAWYRHTVRPDETSSLAVSAGIVDSSEHIDENVYAGDSDTQFLNEVFSLNALASFPSYAPGMVLEGARGDWSLNALVMNLRNDIGKSYYYYYASQLTWRWENPLGVGHYRLFGFITSGDFDDPNLDDDGKRLKGWGSSSDQQLGEILGVFLRTGYQSHVSLDYDTLASVGLNLSGALWGRRRDELGLGYAYLEGEDHSRIDHSLALEGYVRVQLTRHLDLSLDLQYLEDDDHEANRDPRVWIPGLRINTVF